MGSSLTTTISGILAGIVGSLVWLITLLVLSQGIGPYLGGVNSSAASIGGLVFFCVPLPLGFRLLASDSPVSGAWLIALTPIISSLTVLVLVLSRSEVVDKHSEVVLSTIAVLWLLPTFSRKMWNSQPKAPRAKNIQSDTAETVHREIRTEEQLPVENHDPSTESITVLEASDVRKFITTASEKMIRLAHADRVSVSRFFNAIRYGQMAVVRKAVSANPLIVLAKDAYGNTAIEAAKQESNVELESFFKECLS